MLVMMQIFENSKINQLRNKVRNNNNNKNSKQLKTKYRRSIIFYVISDFLFLLFYLFPIAL